MTAAGLGPSAKVSVIGLGIMGAAFARHLRKSGFQVTGYDPDPARAEVCRGFGVEPTGGAAAAIAGMDVVLCSLPSCAALERTVAAAVEAAGASRGGPPPVIVDLSTLELACKLEAQRGLAACGYTMLDSPVSGTGAQAAAGEVVVYASGNTAAIQAVRPVLESFSTAVFDLGAFGNGTRTKLTANLLVAIHNAAAAEAVNLAQRAGMDPNRLLEVLSAGGAAGSRILELRGPLMARREYTPATMRLDLWQKDLRLIEDYARQLGAATPLFDASLPLYRAALRSGSAEADTAAVYEVLRAMRTDDRE